ncbi:MAG: hypothetical protein ACRENJ_00625, partial [Candidatus Eiseniibacteriota bacterium]
QGAWIEIVDPAGRLRVRREVGSLGPGSHRVTIEAGKPPAGIYFLRLICGGEIRTTRLCLLR